MNKKLITTYVVGEFEPPTKPDNATSDEIPKKEPIVCPFPVGAHWSVCECYYCK